MRLKISQPAPRAPADPLAIPPVRPRKVTLALAALVTLLGLALLAAVGPTMVGAALAVRAGWAFDSARATPEDPARLAAAADSLERAARWLPDDPDVQRRLAEIYRRQGRPHDAVAALEAALRLQADSRLLRQDLAAAYEAVGRFEEARTLWAGLGFTAERLVQIGDSWIEQGDAAAALRWYERAGSSAGSLPEALAFRHYLARVLAGVPTTGPAPATLQIYPLDRVLELEGPQLRLFPSGAALPVVGDGPYVGYIEKNGAAVVLIRAERAAHYQVLIWAIHTTPPPVDIRLELNLQPVTSFSLARGDMSSEYVATEVTLTPGLHMLGVRFLNDYWNDAGEDRAAYIRTIRLTALPEPR